MMSSPKCHKTKQNQTNNKFFFVFPIGMKKFISVSGSALGLNAMTKDGRK